MTDLIPGIVANSVGTNANPNANANNSLVTTSTNTQIAGANNTASSKEVTGSSKLSTLDDLKKKSPKLYNMMLQGIAANICNQMKDSQERLKKIMQESRRQN